MATDVKCRRDADYIDFLIAGPKHFSCTEAAKVQPETPDAPAHDAFTRLLRRMDPDPETLWTEALALVHRKGGVLVLDDSTLDKPYATRMDLVTRHHGNDGLTKNDHFRAMLHAAHARGFAPDCVAFDGWYRALENLKLIRGPGWRWLTRLKANRRVSLDRRGNEAVGDTPIEPGGTVVHLRGYGLIRVFRIVSRDGDTEHRATDDLAMDELTRQGLAERTWAIEDYHRGLKRCCGVERCQARAGRAQRNHIGMAIRALLRLERHFYATGVSWYEAKAKNPRNQRYLMIDIIYVAIIEIKGKNITILFLIIIKP